MVTQSNSSKSIVFCVCSPNDNRVIVSHVKQNEYVIRAAKFEDIEMARKLTNPNFGF